MRKLSVLSVIFFLCGLAGMPVSVAQLRDLDEPSPVFFQDPPVLVTLCHIPPGDPANLQTVGVAQEAVPAHLAHGDLLGECPYECDGSPVAQTGQTGCWSNNGIPIDCAGTGHDGEYQYGVSVDPRFADNGDGTVTDNLTGLIWLQGASCFGNPNWGTALTAANTLADGSCGLTDGSVAGDWRLPNVRELHSLIDYGNYPALPVGHPFSGVQPVNYWSSTSIATVPSQALNVDLGYGQVYPATKAISSGYAWPVRGGR